MKLADNPMDDSHKFREVGPEDIGLDRTRIDQAGDAEILREDLISKPLPNPPGQTDQNAGSQTQSSPAGQPGRTSHTHTGSNVSNTTAGKEEKQGLRASMKESVKKVFHKSSNNADGPGGNTGEAPVLADSEDHISQARYVEDKPEPEHHKMKDFLHDPVDTATSKINGQAGHQVSANIAAKEISHGQEVELVRAHDALLRSRNDRERLLAIKDINELMQTRQDQFVRWTMDRHVQKVRMLPPSVVPWKGREEFTHVRNGRKEVDYLAWSEHLAKYYAYKYGGSYIGYTASPPQPSKEVMMPAIERLIVASAPMQELMMTARKIYRWDNPRLTSYYLAGYGLVWAFNMVLPATLLGMVYLILNRKIHEPTLNDLREDVKRTEDRNETALSITEFMEKEGDEGWVDELIRVVGPWIMVQLADLANLMEVLRNFYEWRVPFRTAITVAILTIGALVTAFVPAWLLIRGVTLGMGIAFFGLFPISSRYPDYRLLASPFRWLFWKIPTHAEWAVKQLQAKGARFNETHNSGPSGTAGRSGRGGQGQTQAIDSGVSTGADTGAKPTEHDPLGYRGIPTKLVDGKPVYIHDGSSASGSAPASQGATAVPSGKDIEKQHAENSRVLDYGSYNCKWQSHSGQLILTSHGIRFQSGSSTLWEVPYDKLGRLEKSTRQVANKLKNVTPISSNSGEDLRIITTSPLVGGEEMKFDEAKGQGQEARESRFANASKQGGVTGGTRKKGPEEGKNESTAGRNMMQQVERKEEAGEHGERLLEVKNVQERDQCFSQIVGFSHVQWVVIW